MASRSLYLVFLLFATGCRSQQNVCGKASLNNKIVGGENAVAGSWPWQVSLQLTGSHFCGASLINDGWILSASHCFPSYKAENVIAILGLHTLKGSNNNVSRSISQIFKHPEYNSSTFDNDIALLKMSSTVTFTNYINPICLASYGSTFFTDIQTWVTGWGRINNSDSLPFPGTLQEVQIPIIGNRKCKCLYTVGSITNNMMCAGLLKGGKDSCQGDSGGPLVINHGSRWVQVGIVSFGKQCALKDYPGVYARISQYQDWIDQTIITNLPGYFKFTSSGSNSDDQVSCTGLPAVTTTVAPVVCGRAKLNTVSNSSGPLASAGVWPWIASLQLNGTHVCGGTLISEKFVISSANCFSRSSKPSDWIVKLGQLSQNSSNPNEVTVTVDNITFSNASNNNIAVLKLSTTPTLSDYIQPICVDLENSNFTIGTQCWAAGWGSGGGVQQTLQQFNTTIANCGNASSSNSICIEAIQFEQTHNGGSLMCKRGQTWVQVAVLTLANNSTTGSTNSSNNNSTTSTNSTTNSTTSTNSTTNSTTSTNSTTNSTTSTNSTTNSTTSTNSTTNSTTSTNSTTNSTTSTNSTTNSTTSTNSTTNSTTSTNSTTNSTTSTNSTTNSTTSTNSTTNSTTSTKSTNDSHRILSDVLPRVPGMQYFTKIASHAQFLKSIVPFPPAEIISSTSSNSGCKALPSVASVFLLSLLALIQT